jgi:phosphate/sulfate permease
VTLFGVCGIGNGKARRQMVPAVVMAWLLTLPLSALLSSWRSLLFSPSSEICHQPKD